MTLDVNTILDAALLLPINQRAEIAERLLRSLDGPEPDAAEQARIDAAWAVEIERRERAIDEGKSKLIPGDEVMKKLRTRRQP